MAVSQIAVTEGSGKNVATHSFTDTDSTVKQIQRIAIADSAGNEIDPLGTGTGIADGSKTVTTAGTAVKLLASATPCKSIVICASLSNTGMIAVGASTVLAASGSRRGIPLSPGDSISIDINDVSKVYIDTTVNGEGVTFLYTT